MSAVEITLDRTGTCPEIDRDKWIKAPRSYRCHVLLIREDEGDYSAVVLNLPGVGSCGATEAEAIVNAREAIRGAIESYLDADEEIPWKVSRAADIPDDAKQKWILVHV
jgi:predicted RNase H-like HicB family nuclease